MLQSFELCLLQDCKRLVSIHLEFGLAQNGMAYWPVQVPADLRDYLKLLLSLTPDLRPTPEQVQTRNG